MYFFPLLFGRGAFANNESNVFQIIRFSIPRLNSIRLYFRAHYDHLTRQLPSNIVNGEERGRVSSAGPRHMSPCTCQCTDDSIIIRFNPSSANQLEEHSHPFAFPPYFYPVNRLLLHLFSPPLLLLLPTLREERF